MERGEDSDGANTIERTDRLGNAGFDKAWEAEREEIFRSLDAAGVSSWIVDLKKGLAFCSDQLRFLFGLPQDTPAWAPTELYVDAVHPEDRAAVYAELGRSASEGSRFSVEFRVRSSDGQERWALSRGTTTLDEEGAPVRVIGAVIDITDRRRADDALRESERRRRLAVESAELGFWNIDLATFKLTTDARFRSIFGVSHDDVDFEPAVEAIHPEDQARVRDAVTAAIRLVDPAPYDIEYRVIHADGAIRWIAAKGRANFERTSAGERALSFDGTLADITERKRTEESLRESVAFLRASLDVSAGGFYSVDAEGNTTLCNAAFLQMLGFESIEDVLGRKLHGVIHHSHPDGTPYPVEECPIYRAASTGKPAHVVDEVFFRLDGRSFPVEYWSEPIVLDGEIRGAVTTFVDLTERQRTATALSEVEARFQAIQETTPNPFTIIDAVRDESGAVVDFRWTFVNEATGRLTGEPIEDLMGALVSERRPGIRETGLYGAWLRTLATGEPFSVEAPMTYPNGAVYLRLTGVRVGDGIATTFTDLTQMRLNAERLELAVTERTADLKKAVDEAEGFNYSISHDLRTPLRAIASTSSILLEELGPDLGETHRSLLERQVHNAVRMGKLIDELLRLSRLARAEVKRTSLDLGAEARSVFEELQAQDRTNGCRIEVQRGMTTDGDAGLVRTILHNLLGNACKFSPDGGTIRVGQDEGIFFVRDEGIGFDMAFASKVFMPFERLVSDEAFPGTGIGLANVKRIVERHGGRVWCASEPGKGTTFSFTLAERPS